MIAIMTTSAKLLSNWGKSNSILECLPCHLPQSFLPAIREIGERIRKGEKHA